MKRIVTITMIKNEADILELFVRHTFLFANEMVFIDNGCMDSSIAILNSIKKEGYKITIFNEAYIYYEQLKLENKYINIYSKLDYDLIIPLDVDEFLSCEDDLLKELEALSNEKVTLVNWRTYCLGVNHENKHLFEKCCFVRTNEKQAFTKTIIPTKVYKNENLIVSMGHHDVFNDQDCKEYNSKLYIAHFPVRSEEQIKLKIYQGTISQLMSSYGKVVAFHWKKILNEMSSGCFDIVKYSKEYALVEENKGKVEYLNEPFADKNNKKYEVKYPEYQKTDLANILFMMNQISCIRVIISNSEKKFKKPILVYGTGNTVENSLGKIDLKPYEIIAYIDSEQAKCLSLYEGKLVISPDMIKFIEFDYVVIASIYRSEIEERLKRENVPKDKIIYFVDFIKELLDR